MITGKQRSYLKSLANNLETIMQIGKGGITDNVIKQIDEALEAREIVKIKILENSGLDVKETANVVSQATNSEYVQSIGSKFVLYRESKQKLIDINK